MTLSELYDKADEMVANRYPDCNASIQEMNSYRDGYIHGMTEKLEGMIHVEKANGNGRYPTQMQWFTFLEFVKEMRSEQKDIRTMFDFKTEEEFDAWAEDSYEKQTNLESKVDIMIKELFK